MNRIKQIQALFLLSIISILMFHTAVPHVHHIHQNIKTDDHVHLDTHHDHTYDHHSHKDHESSKSKGFLADLLDDLAHGVHADEYLSADNTSTLSGFNTHFDLTYFTLFQIEPFILSPQLEKNNLHRYALYKQGHCTNPFLQAQSLRAPPTLG